MVISQQPHSAVISADWFIRLAVAAYLCRSAQKVNAHFAPQKEMHPGPG
jgi:hypothetical protein